MSEINLVERIIKLFTMSFSSSFFIVLLLIGILTIVAFVINNRLDREKKPYLYIIFSLIYIILTIKIFSKYGSGILLIGDAFIEKLFTVIYFPNIISYICMIIITLLLMIYTIFNKRINKALRLCNVLSFCTIGFLVVLIIDNIVKNNINIYQKVSIYSNEDLMILIQASMGVFVVWITILIVDFLVNYITKKITGKDDVYIDIDVEEILPYTEEEYQEGYVKYTRDKKYQQYLEEILK